MSADASPVARLRRALARGSLPQAEAAARELTRLDVEDAVELVLLLLRERDARYERAAVKVVGRVLFERPGIGFELAATLLDGFAGLDGPSPEVARSRLALALRGAGLRRAAEYVARGGDLAGRRA